MDIFELFANYAPALIPIPVAILVIVFTKEYVYKGMVPESLIKDQVEREKDLIKDLSDRENARLKEQADRDRQVVETAKDLEQHLEEIVFQLTSLTEKVADEIGESNARITTLERYLSDQIDTLREHTSAIQQLSFQCEKHRKNIPDTTVFRSERTQGGS